jgi:C4-dicarboxylate-specific signal transduction histidine kinase
MVAASKMSALGEMAGGIAHEINNPLAILQLRARQILQLVQPGMEQATLLRKAADNIRQTTDRIAAIIRSLRAIAREGHSDPLVITPMRELIEPTLALCHARFQSQAVTLTVHPFDPGLFVFCRAVEILQVLLNLLNNAFWAVQTLDDRWVNVSVHELNGFVDIQVMDSGMGIDPMLHDRIFLPFFTTRPIGSGTGLGLSIAKAVALDHGGDLWLDSSSAHTLFILRIPKASTEVL